MPLFFVIIRGLRDMAALHLPAGSMQCVMAALLVGIWIPVPGPLPSASAGDA